MFYNKYDIIGTQLLVATNCSESLNCLAIYAYKINKHEHNLSA